ncbi:MAG: hypothetical protein WA761_02155 [Thermoplasmata archaeon]
MGFLVAASYFYSDVVLLVEIAIAFMLIVGMFVVRRGHIRAHMYIQSSMVLVNIPIVLIWMVPEYTQWVLPGIPHDIGQQFYWVPTLMLVAGIAAEALGVFILLVAGTNWIPERLRFRRYKLWMRSELLLWWLVVLLGISTYYVWYVPH